MSRSSSLKTLASRASRARVAALARPSLASQSQAPAVAREYAVLSAAAGGAAGAAALRAAGWNIGYGTILASSLALGVGVYTYEMYKQAKERDVPLEEYVMARPHIHTLAMTSHEGKKVTDADLRGKHALLFFGSLKSSDANAVTDVGRVAKAAAQRSGGAALTPVFITLDAARDTVPDLRRAVSAAGEPSLLALTGDADGVLACANKFRWQQIAQAKRAAKTEDKFKKAGTVDEDYVSNFFFLVGPEGEFLQIWPRALGVDKLAEEVGTHIRSGAA